MKINDIERSSLLKDVAERENQVRNELLKLPFNLSNIGSQNKRDCLQDSLKKIEEEKIKLKNLKNLKRNSGIRIRANCSYH